MRQHHRHILARHPCAASSTAYGYLSIPQDRCYGSARSILVILTSPIAFLSALAELPPLPHARATARAAFLVAPAADELAAESARDNRYMQMESAFDAQRALAQHAGLAQALREDVPVAMFPGDAATP